MRVNIFVNWINSSPANSITAMERVNVKKISLSAQQMDTLLL